MQFLKNFLKSLPILSRIIQQRNWLLQENQNLQNQLASLSEQKELQESNKEMSRISEADFQVIPHAPVKDPYKVYQKRL